MGAPRGSGKVPGITKLINKTFRPCLGIVRGFRWATRPSHMRLQTPACVISPVISPLVAGGWGWGLLFVLSSLFGVSVMYEVHQQQVHIFGRLLTWGPWEPMRVIEVSIEQRRNERAGKREIPEKTRRPTASSDTIPTCENPESAGESPGAISRLKRAIATKREALEWRAALLSIAVESPTYTRRTRDSGAVVVRLLASHHGESGSISGGLALGFLHVGILQDDDAGRLVFSGISRSPPLLHSGALHTHLTSSPSALKASMLPAAQIYPVHYKQHGDDTEH
ncbi:hypothetical protein PR048_016942 [Dryococelus australis]|uniref:Uncharacterized protein n=1 Tax=Dryococelus australis TaxID=614101 RepID=A0ABQ9H844_9NEOP|nr:hypothetical protein PR048_016942 [Dryococelus australis]